MLTRPLVQSQNCHLFNKHRGLAVIILFSTFQQRPNLGFLFHVKGGTVIWLTLPDLRKVKPNYVVQYHLIWVSWSCCPCWEVPLKGTLMIPKPGVRIPVQEPGGEHGKNIRPNSYLKICFGKRYISSNITYLWFGGKITREVKPMWGWSPHIYHYNKGCTVYVQCRCDNGKLRPH